MEDYALEDTIESFLEYFLDILIVGMAILLSVMVVDQSLPDEGVPRTFALIGAVLAAVSAGVTVGLLVRYAGGPYPPALYSVGEGIRWAIFGGVLTLTHEMQRRDLRASRALHQIEIDRVALERRRVEARLQMMQAQIEPHFLFNTLATLKRLYRMEPESGARMLESLMLYLRAALPRLREDDSTLGDELDLIGSYLELLRVRMGARLRYSIEAPPVARAIPFPSMMLITLVENAVKHGLGPKPEGGAIEVRVKCAGRELEIEIRDSGVGFQASSGTGVGLANIRARLEAIYGRAANLVLAANEPCGVVARIAAPLVSRLEAA
jgi:hypothetical protein